MIYFADLVKIRNGGTVAQVIKLICSSYSENVQLKMLQHNYIYWMNWNIFHHISPIYVAVISS